MARKRNLPKYQRTEARGLMKKLKKIFLQLRLRWLERKIGSEFDRERSLEIDRLHVQFESLEDERRTSKLIFWLALAWELVKKAVAPPGDSSSQEGLVGWKDAKRKLGAG